MVTMKFCPNCGRETMFRVRVFVRGDFVGDPSGFITLDPPICISCCNVPKGGK